MPRVLLLMATRTYRSKAFMTAARRLGIDVVVGSERAQVLASQAPGTTVALDFRRPGRAVEQVVAFAAGSPLDAIVGVDDDTTLLAAITSAALGLAHNPIEAIRQARDKFAMRSAFAAAGLPSPDYFLVEASEQADSAAARAPYPCVLKPISLSASRGVIRADSPAGFAAALGRIRAMLEADRAERRDVIVESFLPGPEVALEGLLVGGELRVLALFDKPDPLDGPYFEETIYVTPSRHPAALQASVADVAARAATALGLRGGPVHAELRVGAGGPYVVEVAARSIGGLCSNALRFGTGMSLEEVILRHAVGADVGRPRRERQAAGAMMLPIPRAGRLRAVRGLEDARAILHVEEVIITIPVGQPVVPLPEGDRYLGFVFARAAAPDTVEQALREAHGQLRFVIADDGQEDDEAPCLRADPRLLPMITG